jgi:hypothetical protein
LTADRSNFAGAGVTPAEAALFSVVHYGLCVPPEDLARRAASPDYSLCGRLPVEECRSALAGCLAKDWLQVIDETALRRIAAELHEENLLGPIYHMPWVGGVDFTHAGAAMWQRLQAVLREGRPRWPFAYTDVVRCRVARYFPSRAAALAEIEKEREQEDQVEVAGPVAIGPWRVRWWQRFAEGYRVDVQWRARWEGRCGEGQGWFRHRSPRWRTERDRRREVLDHHGVRLAEWLVLTEVASGGCNYPSGLPAKSAQFAVRDFGVPVTEEQCREAMDACLAKGWLRVIDRQGLVEIDDLLRQAPAAAPLASGMVPCLGEVDFTPGGATLHRAVSEEFLGPAWAEGLCVRRELDREEHRYGETEQDILSALGECQDRGEQVVSCRVVPIGPWCVYWWRRFPRGYRLELEVRQRDRDGS